MGLRSTLTSRKLLILTNVKPEEKVKKNKNKKSTDEKEKSEDDVMTVIVHLKHFA